MTETTQQKVKAFNGGVFGALFEWSKLYPNRAFVLILVFIVAVPGGFFAREAVVGSEVASTGKAGIQAMQDLREELSYMREELSYVKEVIRDERRIADEQYELFQGQVKSTVEALDGLTRTVALLVEQVADLAERVSRLEEQNE